jgi:hypothetical protein
MENNMEYLACTVISGIGATAIMDGWGIARKPLLGISSPDYGMVGRWLGHMAQGRFRHASIAASPPVNGERLIGWSAHYAIGIVFAGLLIGICGIEWIQHPTPGPALAVGIGTVAAPLFLMQPGMGLGIAAWRSSHPNKARIHSLITHAVFGLGLYAAGWGAHFLCLS